MKHSLRSWLWRVPVEQEIDEEIAFHVEMRTRELVAHGLDPVAAREQALARAGDVARLKRTCVDIGRKRDREMRLTQWLEEFRDDVKFALRQLKGSPGFTLVAAVTLALGIGANSAIFALVAATLLRPLPFPDPDRLVLIEERGPQQGGRSRIELLNLRHWTGQNRTFEALAAVWMPGGGGSRAMIGADRTPEAVSWQNVTARFFDVLGVRPIAGRTFLPDDETSAPSAVVLSEGLWRRRFGADPGVVGRDITLDDRPFTVIGVVPAQFQFVPGGRQDDDFNDFHQLAGARNGLWTLLPLPREPGAGDARGQCGVCRLLQVVGRLKPGVTVEAAQADLAAIADAVALSNGETRRPRHVTVASLRDVLIGGELRLTSTLFLGVVGFVLLLCCANVASLVLARATARTRELAVRSALGAGRRRLVAQLLTESLVLAALGGLLGVGVGAAILAAAPSVIPAGLLPGVVTLGFDGRVAAFGGAIACVVGVLFGLAPAWHVTGATLVPAIASESRTATTRGGRVRNLLVVGEVAAAVLVLCGAGLLLRTLLVLDGFDTGYRAEREQVIAVDFIAPVADTTSRYSSPDGLLRFYEAVQREVEGLPGVHSAGWASTVPLGDSRIGQLAFEIVGDMPRADGDRLQADYQIVSHTYFRTVDLSMVAGRAFTERDTNASVPVCVVSEAFAERHLPGRNPIGMRVSIAGLSGPAVVREIVGVARQVKGRADETDDFVQVYIPNTQDTLKDAYLLVRAAEGSADALAPAIRATMARVDSDLPVGSMRTLEDVATVATSRYRFRAVLVGTFALLALVLAMVGVFGVLANSVQQRTREFGVRIALGASTSSVLRLVIGSAARVITAGAVIGLVLAAMLGQLIATFLFGVQALDPVTFGAVAAVLALTAAIATAAPALRATRVDPAVTFRNE